LSIFAFAVVASLAGPQSALAADLSRPPPPPVYAPAVFSWTGFYIGGNLGGAWARATVTDSFNGLNFGGNSNGVFVGGGQAGANYQAGNFVFGVEGTFDWAANNNNTSISGILVPAVGTVQVTSNTKWMTTVAGRLGVAFDRVLLYGKGGGGWVGNNSFTVANLTTGASVSGGSTTNSGWLVGVGVEWAFAPNWTVKAEYDYFGLSGRTFTVPLTSPFLAGDVFTTGSNNVQTVTVGINYLFNWGRPVVARY
jgi:outer membrane immunogenic protein